MYKELNIKFLISEAMYTDSITEALEFALSHCKFPYNATDMCKYKAEVVWPSTSNTRTLIINPIWETMEDSKGNLIK